MDIQQEVNKLRSEGKNLQYIVEFLEVFIESPFEPGQDELARKLIAELQKMN